MKLMMVNLDRLRDTVVVRRLLLPARPAPPTLGGHSVDVVPRQLVDDRPLCIFCEVHRKVLTNNLSVFLQTLEVIGKNAIFFREKL